MSEFSVKINIKAPPETIWKILTDASRWLEWNTTVTRIEGKIAPGEKVTVYVKANPGRGFPLRVSEFNPPKRMVWSDGSPWFFKGERTYTLTSKSDGSVDYEMREVFTGLMAPLISRTIPDLQPSFNEFAACLKETAEHIS
jgi:uncharacterized protein YndB with AHSA1/START domain